MRLLLGFIRRWGEFSFRICSDWMCEGQWEADLCCRYSVFRRITDYYADGSDAFDMRKPLRRDKARKTVRPNGENIKVTPDQVW